MLDDRRVRLALLALFGLIAPLPIYIATTAVQPHVQRLVYGALYLPLGVVDATQAAYVMGAVFGAGTALSVVLGAAYYFEEIPGALASGLGSLPAVAVIAFLTLFGLAWGWGYMVYLEEVDEPGDSPGLDVYPGEIDRTLSDCGQTNGGGECYLELRGLEDYRANQVTRWLHTHGVVCPFPGSGVDGGSVLVQHDGAVYRASCSPHGD